MKLSLLFVATFASMALAMPVAQPEDASLAIVRPQYSFLLSLTYFSPLPSLQLSPNPTPIPHQLMKSAPMQAARQEGDYPIGGGKPCDRKRDPQRKGFTTPTCLKIREEADIAFIAIVCSFHLHLPSLPLPSLSCHTTTILLPSPSPLTKSHNQTDQTSRRRLPHRRRQTV